MHVKYLVFILLTSCFSATSFSELNHNAAFGLGVGVIYGGAGVKLDYEFLNNTYITAGLGSEPSIGLQLYLKDKGASWRPKISLHYGLVGYTTGSKVRDINEAGRRGSKIIQRYYGGIVEFGQSLQFGRGLRHAVDLGLTFGMSDGGKKEWEDRHIEEYDYADDLSVDLGELITTAINIGYRYSF